jgi:hypothetical protein
LSAATLAELGHAAVWDYPWELFTRILEHKAEHG